eukprot:GHVQ01012502.1.p1 GENE.GHVQ01012502.1~~GHVQ01012502.1.p1  ORF type:complete len:1642 (-),score=193.05 GHVQ01012502.1:4978-9903(-)
MHGRKGKSGGGGGGARKSGAGGGKARGLVIEFDDYDPVAKNKSSSGPRSSQAPSGNKDQAKPLQSKDPQQNVSCGISFEEKPGAIVLKPFQRTPKELLHLYCQKQKRAKPCYYQQACDPGMFRSQVVLPDPKDKAKSLKFATRESWLFKDHADHYAALLALQYVEPTRPNEKLLPDPFRDAWLALIGETPQKPPPRGDEDQDNDSKNTKKAKGRVEAVEPVEETMEQPVVISRSAFFVSDRDGEIVTGRNRMEQRRREQDRKVELDKREANTPTVFMAKVVREAIRQFLGSLSSLRDKTHDDKRCVPTEWLDDTYMASIGTATAIDSRRDEILQLIASQQFSFADAETALDRLYAYANNNAPQTLIDLQGVAQLCVDWLCLNLDESCLPICHNPSGRQIEINVASSRSWPPDSGSPGVQSKLPSDEAVESACEKSKTIFMKSGQTQDVDGAVFREAVLSLCDGLGIWGLWSWQATKQGLQWEALLEDLYSRSLCLENAPGVEIDRNDEYRNTLTEARYAERVSVEAIYPESSWTATSPFNSYSGNTANNRVAGFCFTATTLCNLAPLVSAILKQSVLPFRNRLRAFGDRASVTCQAVLSVVVCSSSNYPMSCPLTWVTLKDIAQPVGSPAVAKYLSFLLTAIISRYLHHQITAFVEVNGPSEMPPGVICPAIEFLNTVSHDEVASLLGSGAADSLSRWWLQSLGLSCGTAVEESPAVPRITRLCKSSERAHVAGHGMSSSGARYPLQTTDLTDEIRRKVMHGHRTPETLHARDTLNIWKHQDDIVRAIQECRVVVLLGETGCGKTTQVPRILLDQAICIGVRQANIICSQPRRLAAISVAQRVAVEIGTRVGDLVGYQVRLENKMSRNTRLIYCTHGIMLRKIIRDRSLEGVTCVIVDEVHERSVDVDVLLVALLQALRLNPSLRVIVMSASLSTDSFSQYFARHGFVSRSVRVPGRTYAVEILHAEDVKTLINGSERPQRPHNPTGCVTADSEENGNSGIPTNAPCAGSSRASVWDTFDGLPLHRIVAMLVQRIHLNHEDEITNSTDAVAGAILVFVSGVGDISTICRALDDVQAALWVVPCHGSLPPGEQTKVFSRPPVGKRKVIVATNIAETSITIDDVRYVIDTGTHKETRYDHSKQMNRLVEDVISQASAQQRAGRAGRVQTGECYRLFSQKCIKGQPFNDKPEIQRINLENVCLLVKATYPEDPLESTLSRCIDPPSSGSIRQAVKSLMLLGALNHEEKLTPLGTIMSQLPLDVRLARILAYASFFGCLSTALTICAFISCDNPLLSPVSKREEANRAHRSFRKGNSDFWAKVRMYHHWLAAAKEGRQAERSFCDDYFLHGGRMKAVHDLRKQFATTVASVGLGIHKSSSLASAVTCRRTRHVLPTLRETSDLDGLLEQLGLNDTDSESDVLDNNKSEYAPHSSAIVTACIVAGLYPHICLIDSPPTRYQEVAGGMIEKGVESRKLRFFVRPADDTVSSMNSQLDGVPTCARITTARRRVRSDRVFIHPASMNFDTADYETPFLMFVEKFMTTKPYLRETSTVPIFALLFLSGSDILIDCPMSRIYVDGWLRLKCPGKLATYVKSLRHLLEAVMQQYFIQVIESSSQQNNESYPNICGMASPNYNRFFGSLDPSS